MDSNQFSIKTLYLNNDVVVDLAPSDITVIVGANNCGKSTLLREIKEYLEDYSRNRVSIRKIELRGFSPTDARNRIDKYAKVISDGRNHFYMEGDSTIYLPNLDQLPDKPILNRSVAAFISFLNAENRLANSKGVATFDVAYARPRHPFHVFMIDENKRSYYSDTVKYLFNLNFFVNRIGNPIRGFVLNGTSSRPDSISGDIEIVKSGSPLETQGDGIRSFSGIMAEVQAMSRPVILLDEPEAFLPPPQARKLGMLLVRDLEVDRQAFIATHSTSFLQGVLSSETSKVQVLRIVRSGNLQSLTTLSNDALCEATKHPAIANSNLLDALFFSQTVVCEGDADCGLLEAVVRERSNIVAENDRFWFSSGGKHQAVKVAKLLASFGIDFRIILDLDALTNWALLQDLAALKGLSISRLKRQISDALRAIDKPDFTKVRSDIKDVLENASDAHLVSAIRRAVEAGRGTAFLKQHGLSAIPNGQQRSNVIKLIEELESVGIILLRRGEIESYVPTIGKHGPAWVDEIRSDKQGFSADLDLLARDIAVGLA